jgi:hypothetical protein
MTHDVAEFPGVAEAVDEILGDRVEPAVGGSIWTVRVG